METNINQTCFCGKSPTKCEFEWDAPCTCCGKQYNTNETEFYWCGDYKCKYQQITTTGYVVCAKCFNSKDYDLRDTENDFIVNKTKSNMQIISDKLKTLIDIQQ
eukprot:80930_1